MIFDVQQIFNFLCPQQLLRKDSVYSILWEIIFE